MITLTITHPDLSTETHLYFGNTEVNLQLIESVKAAHPGCTFEVVEE